MSERVGRHPRQAAVVARASRQARAETLAQTVNLAAKMADTADRSFTVMTMRRRRNRILVRAWPHAAILFFQFLLLALNFPLSEIWSDRPLLHIDNAYHLYTMRLAANLAQTGNIRGYDPFFNAGEISGIFNDPSGRMVALLAMLVSPAIDDIRLYKLYVFVVALLCPLAISAASVALGQTAREALIAAILGVFVWWVSYLHWYYTAGLVSYVASAYLGVLFVALIIRYLEKGGGKWKPVAIGLLGALGFFVHPLFPITIGIVTTVYLAIHARKLDRSRLLSVLTIVPLLSLLPNLIWLIPTYLYYRQPYASQFAAQKLVEPGLILRELLGQLRGDAHGSKTYPILFIATVWACMSPREKNTARPWLVLLISAVAIEFVAYIGSTVGVVADLEPNRFAPAGYLLLCIPAARGISTVAGTLAGNFVAIRGRIAAVTAAALLVGAVVLTWELLREVIPGPQGRYGAPPPQIRPIGPYSEWVIDWLERRTSPDARVLFETSLGRVYDDAHMAGYYAFRTKREFIGGPYPFKYFAGFWDGFLFAKSIDQIPFAAMAKYLSVYNIGAILVHSDAAKRYFDAMPGVLVDAEKGKLKAFRVVGQPTFFLSGSGHVLARRHNEVVVTDIVGSEVILKYHFVPGLTTDPHARLDGVRILDDPIPFVRIRNPPPSLRLYVR